MSEKKTASKNNVSARSIRAGGYSLLITAILLAAIIFVNLIIGALPAEYIKFDTTAKQYFTLDTQTEEILASVNEEITIYHVAQKGYEDSMLAELLERYASKNGKIKIKSVDPAVSPSFVSGYTDEALEDNSLIVESAKRSRVVPYSEIIYTDYSNITEEEYYYYIQYGVAPAGETVFAGENAVTSAIDFVTATDIPSVGLLTGHGETALSATYLGYMTDENFEHSELSLLASGGGLDSGFSSELSGGSISVPEGIDCIVINAPTSDISDAELNALLDFVSAGGKIVVNANYQVADLPNMVKLAAGLGIDVCGSLVVEGSQSHYYQTPYWLLPDTQNHDITAPIAGANKFVLFAYSHAMRKMEVLPEGVTSVTPLFTTSDNAYAKAETHFENVAYAEGDIKGNFATAMAVEMGEGKAVWFATNYIADDSADSMVSGGNSNTFLNALGWCCEKTSSVSVRTISMTVEPLAVDEASANIWMIVVAVLIPLSVAGIGFGVWFRRRSK